MERILLNNKVQNENLMISEPLEHIVKYVAGEAAKVVRDKFKDTCSGCVNLVCGENNSTPSFLHELKDFYNGNEPQLTKAAWQVCFLFLKAEEEIRQKDGKR